MSTVVSQNVTITGKTMAGVQITAVRVDNVSKLDFDFNRAILRIFTSPNLPPLPGSDNLKYEIDMTSLTPSISCSVSSGVYSWTIS